tara:strand:+ start:797 stop:1474 length:678 start_codon:yes stop_codon:yes gene_type:complete
MDIKNLACLKTGSDCRNQFEQAYKNRYTWDPGFSGYKGCCSFTDTKNKVIEGSFSIGKDLEVTLDGIEDQETNKKIKSQLWEVAIHRVRRSFDEVHGENTFTVGNYDDVGMEVIIGGKNKGDRYRIKNNIVTMVYRNIHGSLISIFTQEVIKTGQGYISKKYTSEYLDPVSGKSLRPIQNFEDEFIPLSEDGPWVLFSRKIQVNDDNNNQIKKNIFRFFDLKTVD